MYGCVDSPEEYNSGMCFMEGKESEVWGIQNEMNKEPLTPGADEKNHAKCEIYPRRQLPYLLVPIFFC